MFLGSSFAYVNKSMPNKSVCPWWDCLPNPFTYKGAEVCVILGKRTVEQEPGRKQDEVAEPFAERDYSVAQCIFVLPPSLRSAETPPLIVSTESVSKHASDNVNGWHEWRVARIFQLDFRNHSFREKKLPQSHSFLSLALSTYLMIFGSGA